jgi:Restriction endonuclease
MTNSIMEALKQFEATEANLTKLENLWNELQELFPAGVQIGESPEYEDRRRSFDSILASLPKIGGWKPDISAPDWDGVVSSRFDFMELGDAFEEAKYEVSIWADSKEIREYRYRLNQKRRQLIRDALVAVIDKFDADLRQVRRETGAREGNVIVDSAGWPELKKNTEQIEVLLGSSVQKPPRWEDLRRHLHFGMVGDLCDIEEHDWPAVKEGLRKGLYGVNEALPVATADLDELVAAKPTGPIITALNWANINADSFERLIFSLINQVQGYENPEWLMRTNAPDRGRDLSVTRTSVDALSGTFHQRVIIQCKHWLSKSVSLPDVQSAAAQTELWNDPPVQILVVATTGRFTADAVQWIETRNRKGALPRIEMWPESHLESLLAARPALIAQFNLR